MGSGTTQAVAMKTGAAFSRRRHQPGGDPDDDQASDPGREETSLRARAPSTSTARTDQPETLYTGFEVYNVNHYDVFRNPAQAKDLLLEALEVQPMEASALYDGEKDGRMVKIMPVNRMATSRT